MTIRLHHFGIVVANIEDYLKESLWELRGTIVTDSIQRCRLCLAGLPGDKITTFELIEPTDEKSPVWNALKQGPAWHHPCLSVPTTQGGDALIAQKRLLPITPWQPAALFNGRPIRFVYTRNRELLEFLSDED